ncbi:hypothetical protein [Bradyrhizobium sp. AZCC 1721]|uniref:hypothetical protein n=1 Tax=Bradyrhizobium sp. AZCC 1721 TaxID=3117016 RepID=UPI002FEE92E2
MGDLKEARSVAAAGLALDPSFTIRRYRINAKGDNPAYLAKRECFYEECVWPACRRGNVGLGVGKDAPWIAQCPLWVHNSAAVVASGRHANLS